MVNKIFIIRFRLIIIIFVMAFFLTDIATAELGLDFEIPAPENSELLDTLNLKLLGRDVKGITYKSQESEYRIARYYKNFFEKEGFKEIMDKMIPEDFSSAHRLRGYKGFKEIMDKMMPEDTARRLQFKKDNFVVDIVLTKKDYGTDVGIAKYTLPKGVLKIEDLSFSVDDTIFSLPNKDLEGEDFEFIPRPPESIRVSNISALGQTFITYITKLPVTEALEFYRRQMYFEGWQLRSEIDAGKLMNDYKTKTGRKPINFGKANFPIQGGASLEEVMSQAYVLNYVSDIGYATINIMPNILTKGEDTVVQLTYSEAEDEINRK